MKRLYTCSLFLLIFTIQSQTWDWATTYDSQLGCKEEGKKISIDKWGNIYVVGSAVCTTGPGAAFKESVLLFKYSSSGVLLNKDTIGMGVPATVTDKEGNTFVASINQIYKFNSNGQQVWAKSYPNKCFTNICTNNFGGVVIAGFITQYSVCSSAVYMLDSAGNEVWNRIGDYAQCGWMPITCDKLGTTYLLTNNGITSSNLNKISYTGNLAGQFLAPALSDAVDVTDDLSIYITGMTYANTSGNNTNTVTIARYTQQGNNIWANLVYLDGGFRGIRHDNNNNIYLAGAFRKNMQYQSTVLTNTVSLLVMKINPQGNLLWSKNTSGNWANVGPSDFVIGDNNDIYLTGRIEATHHFDSIAVTGTSDYYDMLISKLSQPLTSGIPSQKKSEDEMKIYPTPTQGLFKVESSIMNSDFTEISIINNVGQIVYAERFHHLNEKFSKVFDLSKQPKGMYFIEIKNDSDKQVKKIIVE
ncbi:MAG: regulatory domain of in-like proprotein convertase [Bacteroidetes bacterium]|nr:regulatory domain of in-like proprotein convertase [Bacteroidota bacterium]